MKTVAIEIKNTDDIIVYAPEYLVKLKSVISNYTARYACQMHFKFLFFEHANVFCSSTNSNKWCFLLLYYAEKFKTT